MVEYLLAPLPALPWEQTFEYTVPADLSERGKAQIQEAVQTYFEVGPLPDTWDWSWEVPQGKGPYTGKMTSRVKTWLWKERKVKATKPVVEKLSLLGELTKRVYPTTPVYSFDLTQQLDWKSGEYADSDSCFFSWKKYVNPLVVKGGGGCLRRFRQIDGERKPAGRCYVFITKYGYATTNCRDFEFSYGTRLEIYTRALAAWLDLKHFGATDRYVRCGPDKSDYDSFYADGSCWMVSPTADALDQAKRAYNIYSHIPTQMNPAVVEWRVPEEAE